MSKPAPTAAYWNQTLPQPALPSNYFHDRRGVPLPKVALPEGITYESVENKPPKEPWGLPAVVLRIADTFQPNSVPKFGRIEQIDRALVALYQEAMVEPVAVVCTSPRVNSEIEEILLRACRYNLLDPKGGLGVWHPITGSLLPVYLITMEPARLRRPTVPDPWEAFFGRTRRPPPRCILPPPTCSKCPRREQPGLGFCKAHWRELPMAERKQRWRDHVERFRTTAATLRP